MLSLICFVAVICCCLAEANDYKLIDAQVRNIIFVGRSRAGKTTLIEVLKNKDYNPPLITILFGSKNASLASFSMKSRNIDINTYHLHFNIMDTPGLFERALDINDQRTNDIILNTITKCIDMEITKINHVYFVMSIQQGLKKEDIESFRLFTQLFVGMEHKISIVISFSQNLSNQKQYDHYINQFKNVPDLQDLYNKINGRIFFLGAVQSRAMYDVEKLKKNVYEQRNAFFEHIKQQNDSYNVKDLNIYQKYLRTIAAVKRTYNECCTETKLCDQKDQDKFALFLKYYTDLVNTNKPDDNMYEPEEDHDEL